MLEGITRAIAAATAGGEPTVQKSMVRKTGKILGRANTPGLSL